MAGFAPSQYGFYYQGLPASGGSLNVYQTGTTTPVTIYANGSLTTPAANPLTLDANGQARFYVDGTVNLRLDAYSVNGSLIESLDPVFPVGTSGGAGASQSIVTYKSSSFSLTTANIGENIIATAPLTVILPLTTTLTNYSSVTFNALQGAITFTPQGTERINTLSVGVSLVMPQGSSGVLWTDAAGNWGFNFLQQTSGSVGQYKNLKGSWASNTTATWTATQLTVSNSAGVALPLNSFNQTLNTAIVGAGGLDTGSTAASTWYFIYAIYDGTNQNIIMSLSVSAPTLPGIYTSWGLIGAVYLDGSKNIRGFQQYDDLVQCVVGSNLSGYLLMASGSAGSTSTPTYVAIAIAAFMPSIASRIFLSATIINGTLIVSPNNSTGAAFSSTNPPLFLINGADSEGAGGSVEMNVEGADIYWASSVADSYLFCTGFKINF